jgi:hypothetical protein
MEDIGMERQKVELTWLRKTAGSELGLGKQHELK